MEMNVALWTFVILYLPGLTYNVPIKDKDVEIPLKKATIHSAVSAFVEFKKENVTTRVCQLKLQGSCESVTDGCVCSLTPNSDALITIPYNGERESLYFHVVTVDSNDNRIDGDWETINNGCDHGKWGVGCLQMCDYRCHDNQCGHVNGQCTNGCRPGFKEPSCTKECEIGSYGSNCTGICPLKCNGGYCDIVTGKCHQCQCGYTGDVCDKACESGKYGKDCQLTCSNQCLNDLCYNMNGSCTNCRAAKKGDQCDEVTPKDENASKVETKTDYFVPFLIFAVIAGIEFMVIIVYLIRHLKKRPERKPTTTNKQNIAQAETTMKDAPEDFNKKFYKGLKRRNESHTDSGNLDKEDRESKTQLINPIYDMGAKLKDDVDIHQIL